MTNHPITLRPEQAAILNYRRGLMGISAVPGSGKTWTLSLLAAELVARGELAEDQEVLVVTLANSAVDNFYQRVSEFVAARGLLPHHGFRVLTLHGLANDIVRERPDLAGLSENFQIVDDREADTIRVEAARAWLRSHADFLDGYLSADLDENRRERVRQEQLPQLVSDIALSFIRYAKDRQLSPQGLWERLEERGLPLPLAQMGSEIYSGYQRALDYRGGVDFDDLIRLALQALQTDEKYLERLRRRWPYILEDEAQDSSRLQEEILRTLAGPQGNWVRVGDPNQAIYETFTTADPRLLRQFIERRDVYRQELSHSGRSTPSIIRLANYLVHWTQTRHPVAEARQALHAPPFIKATPAGDPQPNPPDDLTLVHFLDRKLNPQEELQIVADSLARWLPEHPDETVAVLAPRNVRGFELVDELRRRSLEPVDTLLRSSTTTRLSAGVLGNLLRYLSDPESPAKLATVYRVWRREDRGDEVARARLERAAEMLRKIPYVEDYLWPAPGRDWLASTDLAVEDPHTYEQLQEFRSLVQRWQKAVLLPADQTLLTLAQDLLTDPTELAIAHKFAALLRDASLNHPSWRLPELTEELGVVARNERRFLGLSEDDTGFDPERYRGRVVIATMHKAKGLEWDRVYLMSINSYDFPSGLPADEYIAEKWYLRDQLNLEAEALAQLTAAVSTEAGLDYREGSPSQSARLDYVRERLRLLYVGITRARKELLITWNSGRSGELGPALPLSALKSFWEKEHPPAPGKAPSGE